MLGEGKYIEQPFRRPRYVDVAAEHSRRQRAVEVREMQNFCFLLQPVFKCRLSIAPCIA